MTLEKAIEFGKIFLKSIESEKGSATYEFVETAVKMMEQELCEEAISREAVLDVIEREEFKGDAISEIEKLPPVTPHYTDAEIQKMQELEQVEIQKAYELGKVEQPKAGHWINIDATHSKCDRCGAVFEIVSANGEANYCPHCGCRMSEGSE